MFEQSFHAGDDYYDIEVAIRNGHSDYARERLRDVIQDNPDDEAWYLSALVAYTPEQCVDFLERALALNPDHQRARQVLETARQSLANTPPPTSLVARFQRFFRRSMA
jgi:hypothetical protein